MTSKQRAYLSSLAHGLTPVLQIGKSGLTPELSEAVNETFNCRELVKLSVLNNCLDDPRELAEALGGRTRSEVVRVVGRKIVLFRQDKDKPIIKLPRQ
ncbi:MAG: ribosome assembly RNA-binding protein YhbY [Lachnospiraceae bacterium]|nr:ribosome assembly RNA-binding protein YhbY [Lachnospiraceae bacterium]